MTLETVELASQAHGNPSSATPLVILHGLFGSASIWRSMAMELGAHRRVLTLDLRNHGNSPHASRMDYPLMAADVGAFLRASALDECVVMGHSMGGKTAMQLAFDAPEQVASLIVVDIAPVPHRHDFGTLIDAMRSIDIARLVRRADADAALQASIADDSLRRFLLQNLVNDASGFRWRINLDAIEASMTDLLDAPRTGPTPPYPGPALFLRGENSDYVRPEHHERIYRHFPHAEIDTVPGAGHWLHTERPAAFRDHVEAFLRQ